MKHLVSVLLAVALSTSCLKAQHKTENVILITLDGMRWQEVFRGAESRLLKNKTFVHDTASLIKNYWAASAEERRKKLMPFLWDVIAKQGQIYGNRDLASNVNVTNKMWFSYPGYNEILTGFADDARITSNDPIDNPNTNVLEFINADKTYTGKVAAFTSWENFPAIINTKRSHVPVNAGLMKAEANPDAEEKLLNELMYQLPNITGGTRLDALTFHYGFEYLKNHKPKVLYLSFDETDHFAHEGEYDHYLASANYIDGFIKTLWEWTQNQKEYKDKTTFIITVDHGRGDQADTDWRHHGIKMPNADQIWIGIIGPDTPALGEVKNGPALHQNQIAATLARCLGVKYVNQPVPGPAITGAFGK